MFETSWPKLLEYKRNGISEVVAHGAISWFTGQNEIHEAGGSNILYGRSLTKPFQIKGVAGVLDRELSIEAKALSVASHGSEPMHLSTLRTYLNPQKETQLLTPPSMPLGAGVKADKPSALYHPCSGKHAAILRACELNGWPTTDYTSPSHPYHAVYLAELRKVFGPAWQPDAMAKDGCGLPTYSMTVTELAHLYSSLAVTRNDDWIWNAMTERPEIVGGTGRLDTNIMKACGGRVLAKEGADGLLGLTILHPDFKSGLGIAIKIAHGWDPKAMGFIASAILRTLGFNFGHPPPLDRQRAVVSNATVPLKYRPQFEAVVAADAALVLDDQF